jgi:hypothetical protein
MANEEIIFRIQPEHRQKLHELMAKTKRGQSAILAMLLEQAVVSDTPDIQLVGCVPPAPQTQVARP